MSDKYMSDHLLEVGEWVEVASEVRSVAIQFNRLGRAAIHVGPEEPNSDDASFNIEYRANSQEPKTLSLGQLPEDARVFLKALGSDTSVTVLAY